MRVSHAIAGTAIAAVLVVAAVKAIPVPTSSSGPAGSASPFTTQAAYAASGGVAIPDTVTSSGMGKALSSPDIAEMTFGVSSRNNDAEAAMNAVAKTGKRISSALKKQGIAEKDLQTASVSLYPQTDSNGRVTGYEASLSVRAQVRDIAKLGKIIGAATDAGSNQVMGPSFTMDDANPARTKAIENAVADAKARAEVMAKAAGRTIGRIVAVTETGASSPNVYYGERMAKDAMGAAPVPIEQGQLETATGVSVTFELR